MTGPLHRPYPPDRYRGTAGEVSGWVRPGNFFFVPYGGLHGFRGGDHASMLLLFTPGAPREDYFETLAGLAENPLTEEERLEFMLRHDTYWTRP